MNPDAIPEETMDEAMRPYTESEPYKRERAEISADIAAFRETLTSAEQKKKFVHLIDRINNADAEFSVQAYICGTQTKAILCMQNLRK